MDREGVNGPQASGSTYSYACNFLLSFFPLLLSKIPAKKASPSPGLQHREGKGGWPGIWGERAQLQIPEQKPSAQVETHV